MPLPCRACSHPEREAIDSALVTGRSSGKVAEKYGLSDAGVSRHKVNHLSAAIAKVDVKRGRTLLARVEALIERTESILTTAEESGRVTVALSAVREQRELLRLMGTASGELKEGPQFTVNLMASPEWVAIRAAVLEALAPHPEARAAVAQRLAALSGPIMPASTQPRLVGSSLALVGEDVR